MNDRLPRKLAAILYADVAGYSRLTGDDEDATHKTLREYLDLIAQIIETHRGIVMHYAGDAVLAMFGAVVDAVTSATEIQEQLLMLNSALPEQRRVQFRIGVNLGDIIEDRGDIYGDGVNVAARLESIADPGGICVSSSVFEQVTGKLNLRFEDMGDQKLKNIAASIRAFRVNVKPSQTEDVQPIRETFERLTGEKLELPSKPSIAVLPFQNMSGDPEQEYFADGMSEDIITSLSRISDLAVIARNSTFVYKGHAVDVREVGRELGVGFVLEGSIRKSDGRLRITAQLVDTQNGDHVWAEHYDRSIEDIFAVQDEITREIVVALSVEIGYGNEFRVWSEYTPSIESWQLFQRGLNEQYKFTKEGNDEAQRICRQIIEINPEFYVSKVLFSWVLQAAARYGFTSDPMAAAVEAESLAREVLSKDEKNGDAHAVLGYILTNQLKHEDGIAHGQLGVEYGPSVATNHAALGLSLSYAGEHTASITRMKKALRLSPYPPSWFWAFLGDGYRGIGELERACSIYEHLAARMPGSILSLTRLAAIYNELGKLNEARLAADDLMSNSPTFSVRGFTNAMPFKLESDRESLAASLLKAGLPE